MEIEIFIIDIINHKVIIDHKVMVAVINDDYIDVVSAALRSWLITEKHGGIRVLKEADAKFNESRILKSAVSTFPFNPM